MNKTIVIIGVISGIIILIASVAFVFQSGQDSSIATKKIIQEKYNIADVCTFTIYKPLGNNTLMPDPNYSKHVRCHFKIHEELPEYIFQIIGEVGKNQIERVDILHDKETKPILTFSGFDTYPLEERFFEGQDINFDGYLDIRTVAWYGTAGFTGYQYWIFNPESQLFEMNQQLTTFANPEPDPVTQTILTDDAKEGSMKYRWQNGELVRIKN
jgi:hypothetical protein